MAEKAWDEILSQKNICLNMYRINPELKDSLEHEIISWGIDSQSGSLMAYLINRGVNPELLISESQGVSKRAYRKEVSGFRTEISDFDNREYVFLQTHRDGLYDSLPSTIFHQPTKGKTEKNIEETIQEISNISRSSLKRASSFFLLNIASSTSKSFCACLSKILKSMLLIQG